MFDEEIHRRLTDGFRDMGRAMAGFGDAMRILSATMQTNYWHRGVISARTIKDGRRRHGQTKHRRDLLRHHRRELLIRKAGR